MKFSVSLSDFPKFNANVIDKGELLKLCGQEVANTNVRLVRNAAQGVGADGQPIKPGGYSPSYLKAMKAGSVKGRNGVAKPYTETVNLRISGELLNSMQQRKGGDGKSAELFINGVDNQIVASSLFAKGFNHWFEFGKPDLARITNAFDAFVKRATAKILR